MPHKPHRGEPRDDADGVRIAHDERAGQRRRVAVLTIVAGILLATLIVVRMSDRPDPAAGPPPSGDVASDVQQPAVPAHADVAPPTRDARAVVRRRPEPRDASPRPGADGDARTRGQDDAPPDIDARDYIAALRDAGETGGLAAFPPPGTNPPRSGVVVPDDYELPEGFARHYQTTDDGRQLAPVLALAPEYDLLDDAGNRVPLADDRIVPPEYAPPDLPVQMLEIPPGREGDPGGR